MLDKEKILNALDDFRDEYGTSFSFAYMEETSIIEDALDMYYEKYTISDLVKNASKEKTEDIDLEKPQHFTKEQSLWIKKYCSIKNNEFYNQAIDDFADGIREILKDNAIYNMDCINTLVNQLKVKDIEHYKVIGNMSQKIEYENYER